MMFGSGQSTSLGFAPAPGEEIKEDDKSGTTATPATTRTGTLKGLLARDRAACSPGIPMASEEEERDGSNVIYKMKVVQFLDRSVPIILQNDNGPCPLLAISNVLLLRNNVTLNTDMSEISQRELMSLVAEWLLDANSNIQNKDDEFVRNQQQNIADAIQLLPSLATGIDVNVRFRQ